MTVPGYLDGFKPPLVDGSALMTEDLFWPAYLVTVGGAASAPAAFDADPGDLDELVDAFLNPDTWPVVSLRLAGTSRTHIVMRNFPDDCGVDFVLDPGDGSDAIPLAAMEGHFRGPALSWPELVTTTRRPDPDHTSAERLLLLLPACADRDRSRTAADTVAAALTAVGARSAVRRLAEELLDIAGYWSPDCGWTTTADNAVVCLGPHAYRRPGDELTPADLRLVTESFR